MHGGRANAGYSYTMGGRELEVTKVEKDVGVMQCAAAAAKANRILTREEWRELDLSQWPEDHYCIHNMPQYLWPIGLR